MVESKTQSNVCPNEKKSLKVQPKVVSRPLASATDPLELLRYLAIVAVAPMTKSNHLVYSALLVPNALLTTPLVLKM